MMKLFSVFDKVALKFEAPAPFLNDAVAIRAFKNVVDNESSFTGLNYRDFDLMFLGSFDETSGEIVPSSPTFVVSGLDLRSLNNDSEKTCGECGQ